VWILEQMLGSMYAATRLACHRASPAAHDGELDLAALLRILSSLQQFCGLLYAGFCPASIRFEGGAGLDQKLREHVVTGALGQHRQLFRHGEGNDRINLSTLHSTKGREWELIVMLVTKTPPTATSGTNKILHYNTII
jgi:superfamily I DNA/RNA helicase